jgi:hypothetical protein
MLSEATGTFFTIALYVYISTQQVHSNFAYRSIKTDGWIGLSMLCKEQEHVKKLLYYLYVEPFIWYDNILDYYVMIYLVKTI